MPEVQHFELLRHKTNNKIIIVKALFNSFSVQSHMYKKRGFMILQHAFLENQILMMKNM